MNTQCLCDSTYRCRLCAAAPELLAALESALETIKALDEDWDERGSYRRGRAAIRKATGG
jgi:hypothetical protein